jgi:hypothetical protein
VVSLPPLPERSKLVEAADAAAPDSFAPLVLVNLQPFLERDQPYEILPLSLAIIQRLSTTYPAKFLGYFPVITLLEALLSSSAMLTHPQDYVDLLVGWRLDPSLPPPIAQLIVGS